MAAHLPPQHSPIPAPLVCAPAALHPQKGGVLFPPASPAKTLPFPAARARISSSTSSAPRTAHNLRAPGEGRRGYGRRRLHAGGRQASGIEARFVRPPLLVSASGISFVRFVESLCFRLVFSWLDRCEASAGFHLLLQETAAGAPPSISPFGS